MTISTLLILAFVGLSDRLYFKPDAQEYGPRPPHPVATECDDGDQKCIAYHDRWVWAVAVRTQNPMDCETATRPEACIEAVKLVAGEVAGDTDPMLTEPCTFVVRVEKDKALLYSRARFRSRWAKTRGEWRPGAYVGTCGVQDVGAVQPMLPWERGR